jgi:putative protease
MPKFIPKRMHTPSEGDPTRTETRVKPQLMAPAGDWDCVKAAVAQGADAVYFGLDRFNARMRAHNFTRSDLPELMAYLHRHGVKGYLTFNTLVFTHEIQEAAEFLEEVIRAGVDAAIVQDVGICQLIRKLSPDFPIHASTQMTISSEAGVRHAVELGASVVVLARECSLEEIASMKHQLTQAGIEVPIEIFVHGALCVAYSGQCLTSESLGGRSANRGECAQACRLPYDLLADGRKVELGDRRYLLSPQDLSGASLIPEMIRAGIHTLKIEGRLKSPEYVAAVTQVYRRAIDQAWEKHFAAPHDPNPGLTLPDNDRYLLEMTFSRGLGSGWLEGIHNQRLVHARFGKKRGVYLGKVDEVTRDGVWIIPEAAIRAGDGVVFDAGRPDLPEEGGRVYHMQTHRDAVYMDFMPGALKLENIRCGDLVWKTSDPALEKQLKRDREHPVEASKSPIRMRVRGSVGTPLTLEAWDGEGHQLILNSSQVLIEATQRPLDTSVLEAQLGRLGGTPFCLESLENQLDGPCMLPISALNLLRREVAEQLDALRQMPKRWTLLPANEPFCPLQHHPASADPLDYSFIPYLRTWDQFECVLKLPYAEIYLELENPRDYARASARLRESDPTGKRRLWVAPPRIFKAGEDWVIDKLKTSGADGFLVRNHEHLNALQGQRLRGDFSLNIANPLSAEWYVKRWNLERLTASYDLNHEQLDALLRHSPSDRFEVTIHQHMPMFHMEHCVFCAFLTKGKDFRDCGRPCDSQRLALLDRVGMQHPVKADAGCRNTVFNAKAQSGAEFLGLFAQAGVRAFRIEFLEESADEVCRTLELYEQLKNGTCSTDLLWKELKLINQLGVTRGTLRTDPHHA